MRRLRPVALSLGAMASPALAHGGAAGSAVPGWTIEPVAMLLLASSVALYGIGRARMTAAQREAVSPPRRATAYALAVTVLVAALFSPLDALADSSFAWHMFQHLLLMLVAAPLLAVANTHLVSLFALPMGPRRVVGRTVSGTPGVRSAATARLSPMVAAALFACGLWLWHAPKMYDAALAEPVLHTMEHLTFVVTSAVFWRMVLRAGDRRLDPASAILLTVVVGLQANLLAALILLSPGVLYSTYRDAGLRDQQLAALLMFVPASLVFLVASIASLAKLMRSGPARRATSPASSTC